MDPLKDPRLRESSPDEDFAARVVEDRPRSALPWLLSLALALACAFLARGFLRLRSDLAAVRSMTEVERRSHTEKVGPQTESAPVNAGPPSEEEQLALMGLVQAAKIADQEEEIADLKKRLGEIQKEVDLKRRLVERQGREFRRRDQREGGTAAELGHAQKRIQQLERMLEQAQREIAHLNERLTRATEIRTGQPVDRYPRRIVIP